MFKKIFLFVLSCISITTLTCCTNSDSDAKNDQKERTLSIIKPDAIINNHIGEIIAKFESEGLHPIAIKIVKLNKKSAGDFYAVHKERPFYDDLVTFMSSGPIVVMVLEGEDAVVKNRKIMGATDPADAEEGTIRRSFAKSKGENSVHGSDSHEAAKAEIAFFFKPNEIVNRD